MSRKLTLLPVLFLLLVTACGDGDAIPTTTGATQTPPQPPTRTPAASASSTPVSQSDTPTPEEASEGLTFHFGPAVDDFDRSLIRRAVEVTRQLLRDESGVLPPAAVFAYDSPVALARAFAEDALAQEYRAEGMAGRLVRSVAEASYRGIVINTGFPGWQGMEPAQRVRAVAHEFVHVIQLEQAGLRVADETFLASNTLAPPAGPYWLLEGSAEVVSWLVLQELSLGSYDAALRDYAAASRGAQRDLAGLEAYFGFSLSGSQGLGVAALASDYLVETRSLGGLFEFWDEIGRGSDWRTAFTRQFGASPASFSQAFQAYYAVKWAE